MTAARWAAVDDATDDLLSTLAADWRPFVVEDMNLVAQAIRADAESHGGRIDPNRVRRALDGRVKPQRVGITYRSLRLAGQIAVDGYGTNDDTSGNAGKPQLQYRWTG
jgi:hypothetical protein